MSAAVRVDDLMSGDTTPYRKLWGLVLLMAIRDRAASVHYHPWRADGPLSYVIGNTRHVLEPPPAEAARLVIAAARELASPRRGRLARLFAPRPATVCGSFTLQLETEDGVCGVEWDVVCWQSGLRTGVEFFQTALSEGVRVPPQVEPLTVEPRPATSARKG